MDSVIFDFNKKQFFRNYKSNYLGLRKHLYNQLLHISKLTSVDVETLFYDIFYKQYLKIKIPHSTMEMAKNWNKSVAQNALSEDNIIEYLKTHYGLEEFDFDFFKNRKFIKVNCSDYVKNWHVKICTKNSLKIHLYRFHESNEEYHQLNHFLRNLIDHKYSKNIYFEHFKRFKKRKFKDAIHRHIFCTKLTTRLNKKFKVKDFLGKNKYLNSKNILMVIIHKQKHNFLYLKNNEIIKIGHSLNEDMSENIVHSAYVL